MVHSPALYGQKAGKTPTSPRSSAPQPQPAGLMHLTLLIPELLWPEPGDPLAFDGLACPSLETWLGRSRLERSPPRPLEAILARQLGLTENGLAACRLQGETNAPQAADRQWFCADPVHLKFHHDRIILGDASLLALEAAEVEALLASLNATFPDLGRFHAPHPRRWYLEAAADLELPPLPPLSAASGRQLGSLMPESPRFSRLMNELQMLLHDHPVNRAREARRQPTANGLWLWGGGALAAPAATRIERLGADDPLARGMARHLGLISEPAPATLADWPPGPGRQALILLEHLLAPTLIEDSEAWRDAMARLERDWFAPLAAALGKSIARLDLISPTAFGVLHWEIRASDRWKLWRRTPPLAALTRQLALSPENMP